MRALWTQTYSGNLWTESKTKVEVLGLPEANISRNAKDLMGKVEIVEPNGRSIVEIVEAYKDTHYFPDMEYLKYLRDLGIEYSKIKKWNGFLEFNSVNTEKLRGGILKLIPSLPSAIIDRDRIASNDNIILLGELYEHPNNTYTTFSIPYIKWNWLGEDGNLGGQYAQRYLLINGTITAGSFFDCGPVSNASYDVLLIRK